MEGALALLQQSRTKGLDCLSVKQLRIESPVRLLHPGKVGQAILDKKRFLDVRGGREGENETRLYFLLLAQFQNPLDSTQFC